MAGITLETAQRHLDTWLEAEATIATGQAYTIGSRSLTRANLADVRKQIDYWQAKVVALTNTEKGKGRNRVYRAMPMDN
jgi:hypothetical protein